ncbi:MAG TPA: Wzz/FepE/Etk N-terminal domain-containing protein, partial [Thermomicrobiales bacterium]|nr:Wzz/FepE/Etk N-terminal domain-containing protein [Thermomicrobiales bacterium]
MELDLRQLAQRAWRWWWVILAIPAALAIVAYLYTARQSPLYLAEVSLEVKTTSTDNAYDALLGSERQAKTYQRLVKNNDVLTAAAGRVDPPMDVETLEKIVSSRVEPDTSLLLIGVSDTDPIMAAKIANIVADEVVSLVATRNQEDVSVRTAELQANVDDLENQIDKDRAKIVKLESGTDAASAAVQAQIADLNDDIARNQNQIELFRTQIGATVINQGDSVKLFTPAVAPKEPYAPRKMLNMVLAILTGLLIATG